MNSNMPFYSSIASEVINNFQKACQSFSPEHLIKFYNNKEVSDKDNKRQRLLDYVFSQEHALVTESSKKTHLVLDCIHHHRKSWNTQKLLKKKRKRKSTFVKQKDCSYSIYISVREVSHEERRRVWLIDIKNNNHNHSVMLNFFQYSSHQAWRPELNRTMQLAYIHWVTMMFYMQSARVLDLDSLHMTAKKYYNLICSEKAKSKKKKIDIMLTALVLVRFHVSVLEKYKIDPQTQKRMFCIVEQIFFCFSEQITLARCFVNNWMLKVNATFNTNKLHLSLSVIIDIINIDLMFSVTFFFIISESAEFFTFIEKQMQLLMWYDCSEPKVVVSDQTKGLIVFMTQTET